MRPLMLLIALVVLIAGSLSACLMRIPGDGSEPVVTDILPQLGPDERYFDSPCRHFGNETPFSDRPVHEC